MMVSGSEGGTGEGGWRGACGRHGARIGLVEHPATSKVVLEQGLGVVSKQRDVGMAAGLGIRRGWLTLCPHQKADQAVLETKVSQEELQRAVVQLSEMMKDLLQRMSLLDRDRQKALEKILSEMDPKVTVSPGEGGGMEECTGPGSTSLPGEGEP